MYSWFLPASSDAYSHHYKRVCPSVGPSHYGTEIGQIETKPLLLFNLLNFHPILLKLGTKVTYNPRNEKKKIFQRAVTIS